MSGRPLVLIALLVLGAGAIQPHAALAATITDCPATEAALSADIASAGGGGTVSLVCPSATTIPFTTPIEISLSVTLDASQSPGVVTFDGQHQTQLLVSQLPASLTLRRLALVNGSTSSASGGGAINAAGPLDISDSSFTSNAASSSSPAPGGGGAISAQNGVTISNSTLSDNTATGSDGEGGAIYAGFSTVTIRNSNLFGNSAQCAGGAIVGNVTVTNSTISSNSAMCFGGGGAIDASSRTASITNSTLANNFGGAVVADQSSTLRIANSILSDNSDPNGFGGGAIFIGNGSTVDVVNSTLSGNSAPAGGAIWSFFGTVTITSSTLSGNSATATAGGAILTDGSRVYITSSTLTGNSALSGGAISNSQDSTVNVGQSIIASSRGGNCANNGITITDQGYNLTDKEGNCGLTASTDLTNTDPQLDPRGLQNNGGPTPTIALLPTSPAIDAGPATCTPSADQRGVPRPQGKGCDIGAYESPYTQLISNGGFEHGLASWGAFSLNPAPISPSIPPHDGSRFLSLCGYVNCLDALWQSVPVPASFNQATFSFWLDIISQEPAFTCNDHFYVLFLTSNGSIVPSPFGTCNTNTNGWVQVSLNVSSMLAPYKGQHVTLLFLGTGNATLPTSFSLDDVSLVTSPASGAAAQASGTQAGPLHPVPAPPCLPKPVSHQDCKPR